MAMATAIRKLVEVNRPFDDLTEGFGESGMPYNFSRSFHGNTNCIHSFRRMYAARAQALCGVLRQIE